MDKAALRKQLAAQKRALTPEQIERASEALTHRFLAHPFYRDAKTVYAYASFNQEVQTAPLILRALQDGKRVALPKVVGREMRFLSVENPESLIPGAMGIPEPPDGAPIAHDERALVLMPGLAFDRCGNRLGYGGGFYDRFLCAEPNHPTLALCYDFQIIDHVPVQAHDIPVQVVLSCPV